MQKGIAVDYSPVNARGNPERARSPRPRLQGRRRSVRSVALENAPWPEEAKGAGRGSGKTDARK